jgi:GT2 family glycosyltransferase
MMTSPRTTIVIPNWNGQHFLGPCLAALRAQSDRNFGVVVVDNASDDGSAAFVEQNFPEVKLLRLDVNRGFAAATNAGIELADNTYVAFLNNDCEPSPSWLAELVGCLERHPRAAAATSKLVLRDQPEVIDDAGDLLSIYFRAYERGRGDLDGGQYEREEEVFGASGAASLWRLEILRRIGGFDEDFFAYYEDVDLSFRARLIGCECWYAPQAVVQHARAGTSRAREAEFVYFYGVRNRWAMIVMDVPLTFLVRAAPRLVFAEMLTLGRALRERQARQLLRAHGEIVRLLPALLRRRRTVQACRVVSTGALRAALTPGYPHFRARFADVLRQSRGGSRS